MKTAALFLIAGITWAVPTVLTLVIAFVLTMGSTQGSDPANALAFALLAALIAGAAAFVYLLPSFIAALRAAPRFLGIYLLNLLAGWSFIGWVAALIWSFVDAQPAPQVVYQVVQGNQPPPASAPPPLPPASQ